MHIYIYPVSSLCANKEKSIKPGEWFHGHCRSACMRTGCSVVNSFTYLDTPIIVCHQSFFLCEAFECVWNSFWDNSCLRCHTNEILAASYVQNVEVVNYVDKWVSGAHIWWAAMTAKPIVWFREPSFIHAHTPTKNMSVYASSVIVFCIGRSQYR